jgi:hypothetical protein
MRQPSSPLLVGVVGFLFFSAGVLGVRNSLRWSDLRSVRYSRWLSWFRLETRAGAVVRISNIHGGLGELVRLILRRPPQAVDDQNSPLLQALAHMLH